MLPAVSRVCLLVAFFATACVVAAEPPPRNRDAEWSVLGNGADAQHYSTLAQIDAANVGKLGLAWVAEIPSRDGLAGNPLVANGIVFQSGPQGRVYANDLRTGASVWTFDPQTRFALDTHIVAYWSSRYNRGLALLDDLVFVASGDCQLYALEQKTGKLRWQQQSCDPKDAYGMTGAPRVGKGLVFVGNNCGDTGASRGYVDAFEASTGRRKWRFHTVPDDPAKGFESELMRKAAATWGTDWYSRSHGCGSVWDAMTYDEKLNRLYIGVAGPAPWSPAARAPDAGDELFTNSIVALDADTGNYVWHFKSVPNDGWNFDSSLHIMLADLPIEGRTRRVVMQAHKNGFFYVLDAQSGKFISGKEFLPQNWALGLDPKTGRPTQNPDAQHWKRKHGKTVASPGPLGNKSWQAMAFNKATGLVYLPAFETPTLMEPDPQSPVGGMMFDIYYGLRGDPKWKTAGHLIAWDPVRQEARWRVRQTMPVNGGILSTAGNLVFQGQADGQLIAYAADSGRKLWSFDTKESIIAAPTTVTADGVQYVLVPVGNSGSANVGATLARLTSTPETRGPSRLLAFKLDGKSPLPPFESRPLPKPALERQPAELASAGRRKYETNVCVDCHGLDVISAGGTIKDLRYSSLETHQQFAGIVLGARFDKGMPAFTYLSLDDIKAIQAYVVNRAWDDYETQSGILPAPQRVK
jgi:quinohemoprotein ethanol dehydrogenase